jgi:hypothetical protein
MSDIGIGLIVTVYTAVTFIFGYIAGYRMGAHHDQAS